MYTINLKSLLPLMVLITVWVSQSGCRKNDKEESCDCKNTQSTTCVFYEQTGCFDPWGNHPDEKELIHRFIEHFDRLGVYVKDVCVDHKGTQDLCLACTCRTGIRFLARVKNSELKKAKDKGLREL
jgi:hypothetical protein